MLKHTINTHTHTHRWSKSHHQHHAGARSFQQTDNNGHHPLSVCPKPSHLAKELSGTHHQGYFCCSKAQPHNMANTHTQTHVALTYTDRHAHSKGHTFTHFCCVCKHPYCIHRPFTSTYLHAHSAHSTYLLFTEKERRLKALLKL